MRRKIILQGNKSFTLTLPINWVRSLNLGSGDEVDLSDTPEGLLISTAAAKRKKSIVFDVPDNYSKNIKYLLRQLYRQGYDTITLKSKDKEIFKLISDIVKNDYIGMEIIEQKPNQCTMEVLIEFSEDKFNTFFRKLFQIIGESLVLVKDGKDISDFYNKFSAYQDYCKRYVANLRKAFVDYEYYSLLSYLVNVEADLSRFSQMKKKPSVEFDEIIALFGRLEHAFFKDDLDALASLNKELRKLADRIEKKTTVIVVHYEMEILRFLYGAVSPMIGIVVFRLRK